VSYTSSAASQAAPSKHDSGFHEDEQHKVVDDNQVALPTLHQDSAFYEPTDDDMQDKNSSPALPVLGEESKSVAIPSASVAAPIRGDNAGRITVEEGSTEDISTVEGANSVDTLKVVREGYAATPVLDEVNPEPTPTIEGDDAENKHVIHNSIECGSTELHVPVAVKVDGDSINVNDSTQPPRPPAPRGKPRASSGSIGSLHRVVLASVLDEPPQAEADSSQSTSPKEFAVSHVSSHRPAADGSDRLELLVHWAGHGEEPTWEPEEQVHLGARDTVAKYWAGVEGGRVAVRPYEVFAIRGSKTTGKGPRKSLHLRVEWLGYVEETWEPVARFSKDQPKLVERYFELVGRPQKPQYNR